MTTTWTAHEIDTLKTLRAAGNSFQKIAMELHRTRNSVIGYAQRNPSLVQADRSVRIVRVKRPPPHNPEPASHARMLDSSALQVRAVVIPPKPVLHFDGADGVALPDLRPMQCKWPVADAPVIGGMLFCGKASPFGDPYCPHHRKLSLAARRQ